MAVVYRHRRGDTNEVFYIGIGKTLRRPYRRDGRSDWWSSVVSKHGYSVEVLKEGIPWVDACELEQFLINEYGRKDLGLGNLVNMTDGGEGGIGRVISEEHKKAISNSHKGRDLSHYLPSLEEAWKVTRGSKMTKEQRHNMGHNVLQYSLSGEFIKEFNSAYEVKCDLGICHVGDACKNKRKTAGGFIWKYKEIHNEK